jgi:hypothetical protein
MSKDAVSRTAEMFADAKQFSEAIVIKNCPQGHGRNVAEYNLGEEWIMNAYESIGGPFTGIEVRYMLEYVLPDGRYLIPEKHDDTVYDETCVFGKIDVKDIPNGCRPFDCGYGGAWCLFTENDDDAIEAAFLMWKRRKSAEKVQAAMR